jgi:hypothetical protein
MRCTETASNSCSTFQHLTAAAAFSITWFQFATGLLTESSHYHKQPLTCRCCCRYRVVAPDLRSHGETTTADDADFSAEVRLRPQQLCWVTTLPWVFIFSCSSTAAGSTPACLLHICCSYVILHFAAYVLAAACAACLLLVSFTCTHNALPYLSLHPASPRCLRCSRP